MTDAEKLRPINLARILYSTGFLVLLFLFDLQRFTILSGAHLLFSVAWFGLIETGVIVEEKLWWSGYVPAFADTFYLTLILHVTGNISSFLVMGYVITITLSSMTDERNYGIFTALCSAFFYITDGFLVATGIIQPVNIFGEPSVPSVIHVVVAGVFALSSFVLVNRILSGLFYQLNQEVRDRKAAEAHLLRDLEMARIVQERILPEAEKLQGGKELRFGSRYLALESVGGDLYDIIRLSPDRTAVLIADVSGHGVPAALVTTMAKAVFTAAVSSKETTGEMIREVNRSMYNFIGDLEHYLSAFLCIIDLAEETVTYTVAGHPLALLIPSGSEPVRELESENTFLLGVRPDFNYTTNTSKLTRGDRILMFTDGVVETVNPAGEQFGSDRLISYVQTAKVLSPGGLVRSIINELELFSKGEKRGDDVAVVCLEYQAESSQNSF